MNTPVELAEDAARLISFALRPRLRPSREPRYAELLKRYRNESGLREHVTVIARGLGLAVLGETELGLVVGAQQEGPFALRLSDYRRQGLSVDERMCHGLLQLAVAAYCFPTAGSLEDPDSVAGTRVSVHDLVHYVEGLCEELEERSTNDAEAGKPELREAWRTVLGRAATRTTPDGRQSAGTLAGMAAHALGYLEHGGLMRKIDETNGGTWQALAAYRIQVRELGAHESAALVREAGARARGEV